MNLGDRVVHTTFPVVQGIVVMIQPSEYMTKVAVLRDDTNTLIWDNTDTWTVLNNEILSVSEVSEELDEENIIDGEFREID